MYKRKETLLPFLNRPKGSLLSAFWCSKNKTREISVGADGAFKAEQIRKSFLIRYLSVSCDCLVCEEVVSHRGIICSCGFSYRCYAHDTRSYLLSPGEPSVPDEVSNCLSANHFLHYYKTSTLTPCLWLLPRLFRNSESWVMLSWLFLIWERQYLIHTVFTCAVRETQTSAKLLKLNVSETSLDWGELFTVHFFKNWLLEETSLDGRDLAGSPQFLKKNRRIFF